MKHRRVPRWAEEATEGRARPTGVGKLSDLIGRLEMRCDQCDRHGLYRADRLIADFGDIPIPDVLQAIARRAQCPRALKPPTPGDISYANWVCKIRRENRWT